MQTNSQNKMQGGSIGSMFSTDDGWSSEESHESFLSGKASPTNPTIPIIPAPTMKPGSNNYIPNQKAPRYTVNSAGRITAKHAVFVGNKLALNSPMADLIAAKLDYSSSLPPRKIKRIVSSLPARLTQGKALKKPAFSKGRSTNNDRNCLQDEIMSICAKNGYTVSIQSFQSIRNFFFDPTEKEIDAYKHDVINAVRKSDLDALRAFQQQGRPLKCSNRFGESLLHLACRSSLTSVVNFLVNEAGVPVRVRDDFGRTPLHDAFWTPKPNFELIDIITSACPDLFYISDSRGQTALSYVRADHIEVWRDYFAKKKLDSILPKVLFQPSEVAEELQTLIG